MLNMYNYPPMPTITDVISKGQQFCCEFVDLKRNGFHHYTKALNNMTGGFWKPMLDQSDKQIADLADSMKLTIRLK